MRRPLAVPAAQRCHEWLGARRCRIKSERREDRAEVCKVHRRLQEGLGGCVAAAIWWCCKHVVVSESEPCWFAVSTARHSAARQART